MTMHHTMALPIRLMSDLELHRSHLVTARAALNRYIDQEVDPDGIMFRGMEALIANLEADIKRLSAGVLLHDGVEYAEMAGRA